MNLPANIEPSPFKRGQYIGYSGFHAWRIVKTNSSSGRWYATPATNHGYDVQVQASHIYAHNLSDMGQKLMAWGEQREANRKRHMKERNEAIEKELGQ